MAVENENKNEMDFKKIGLIGAAALLALVLLGYAVAFVVTESSYAVFSDNYYKFKIKYPKRWKALPDYGGTIVTFISSPDNELDTLSENLNISVSDLPEHITTLEQFSKIATVQMEAVFEKNIEVLQSQEIIFAGLPAYSYEVQTTQSPGLNLRFVWFFKDNKAFVITYVIQEYELKKYRKIFKHMLRSFTIDAR